MKVTALIGAQYGSEGKGAVVAQIAHYFDVHVRTGGPNAGHTIWHEGRQWKMRSVPCGWINPEALLVIGPGAVVDPGLLVDEIDEIEGAGYDIKRRLFVDVNAGILEEAHAKMEGGVEGHAHKTIGSTGEGVGVCRIARISRGVLAPVPFHQAKADQHLLSSGVRVCDTLAVMQHSRYVLLEGTQGHGLSLTHGPWPHVTSADTSAAQLCADAGISPRYVDDVRLVARTFPIRVAGESGPLKDETTWGAVGVEAERTTVTGKIRRVGEWNPMQVRRAAQINGAESIYLMFVDYLFPEVKGVDHWGALPGIVRETVCQMANECEVALEGIGTGPDTVAMFE
jgi:adenylosuccinate synthase